MDREFTRSDGGNARAAAVLRYAAAGMRVFPIRANKTPLVAHWPQDASSNPEAIKTWLEKWPSADFGWAIPEGVVVADLDERDRRHGLRDFRDRAGCDPHDVATPTASTPSGGLHVVYGAAKAYKNLAPAISGTGIDTKAAGGYIGLPLPGNGREWLRPLIGADGVVAPLLPAPAWLDCVVRKTPSPRAPLVLAPRSALVPSSSDTWAQKRALAELERACAKIAAAPRGEQDSTRHAQCFYIGSFIARGDLGYAAAYEALLKAARAMPVHRVGDPWRNLDAKVASSIERGITQPLALSKTEQWARDFRARMRSRRPPSSAGVRNGR